MKRITGNVFFSCLLAELFLNSLSQPYSLEEQEQMLSCLSIDSPFVSDASEKVSSDGGQALLTCTQRCYNLLNTKLR